MKQNHFLTALFVVLASAQDASADVCSRFTDSSMSANGVAPATWRVDFPSLKDVVIEEPWKNIDFKSDPRSYMHAVLDTAKEDFRRDGERLVGTGSEDWWIVPWLDYTHNGREPLMGLTKERGPRPGDLSPTNTGNHQVWAVGFYNAAGAAVVGEIFADPCNPAYPTNVSFPEGTVSVKFLFTDAPTDQVTYLANAPTYHAFIDASGQRGQPASRMRREMRLLQVDIAVRDSRANPVGWVFGAFAWIHPPSGDELFDNLEPVSLQWGDDPGVTLPERIQETWINPGLEDKLYGWPERPTLGFLGRANGPADNIRSSCISCHASARVPSAPGKRLRDRDFDMVNDLRDPDKVKAHVETWFINLPAGELFAPDPSAVSALDYSLQLHAAAHRMCRACEHGKLTGRTPDLCRATKLVNHEYCPSSGRAALVQPQAVDYISELEQFLDDPPRQ